MYQYRVSKVAPFWARNNDNKPNNALFQKWLNDNMVSIDNLPIHIINFTTFTLNGSYNDIKYIEVKNINDENDIRYYYVDAIELDGGNNTFKYRGVLDVYTSYTLKFLNDNMDNEFVFMRQHEYDKKALQLRDNNLDTIPKIYKAYQFKIVDFNFDADNKVWYGKSIGLRGTDLFNANKYYVFKDGVNGGYEYYPILSKALDAELFYSKKVKGSVKYEGNFRNGQYNDFGTIKKSSDISSVVNANVVDAYEKGNIVEYYYQGINYGYRFPAHTVWLSGWKQINGVPYGTLPIDVVANTSRFNNAGAGLQEGDFYVYLLGNQVYSTKHWNITASKHGDLHKACSDFLNLKVKVFNTTTQVETIKVKNSLTGLEQLRKKTENVNKFLGVYYLPHFLNFNDFQQKDGYVYININPQGDNIDYFNIYDYNMSNIDDKLNNTSYSTPYVMRYLMIRYYGNIINAEYRVNDMYKIFIGGKLFFTDTANIISKSDDLISLDKSIITYPYQLPIGVDTYEQYVKANRGTTDTSFSIAKQQQDLQFAQSIFGGVMGVAKAGAKAATGDFVGAAFGAASTAADLGFGIAGQLQGMAQMEQKIRAQYEKANNTMGNEIHFSNINNASLTHYYDSENGEQYEGVEVSDLDDNTLSLINNYIVLNGYLLPNKTTIRAKIENDRLFNYVQLDATLLINQLNLKYDDKKYNNEIYNLITQQLTKGIRIWNKEGEDIPEYDQNDKWPDQPTDTRPNIPDPTPPQIPEVVDWEKNIYGISYFVYYDNNGALQRDGRSIVQEYDSVGDTFSCNLSNSDATSCSGASFYSSGPQSQIPLSTINIISKYGLCNFQGSPSNTLYLVAGIPDENGYIIKLTIPNIDTTHPNYEALYDYSKSKWGVPPTNVGLIKVKEIWLNGVKKYG